MAARGSILKEQITKKILETFPGSFIFNKEIRIEGQEGGETLQIKCTLTCAKENVDNPNGNNVQTGLSDEVPFDSKPIPNDFINEPTEDEKQKVEELCKLLGLT